MSEINDAATNIYNRLAAAPTFHPAGADLFTDWNLQSGDVVTVKSGNESYNVPIYNMRLHWAGDSKIEVESTGNPEREPLPAIKRREYASGSSTYSGMKSLSGGVGNALNQTAEINGTLYAAGLQIDPVTGVWLYASEHGADYALGSSFKVQSDAITAEVSRASAAEGTMSSRITQTADAITAEVTRATGAESSLSSRITVTADQISTEVTNRQNADNVLQSSITQNANQIALKVSNGNVATQLSVECGNVTVSGGNLIVSGYITSAGLRTEMGAFNGPISSNSSITANSFYIGDQRVVQKMLKMGTASLTNTAMLGLGTAGDTNLDHYHGISMTESGGVVTATIGAAQSTAGTASFNIADTQFYRNAAVSSVSVSLTGTPGEDSGHYYQAGTARLTTLGGTTTNKNLGGIVVDSAVNYGRSLMGVKISGNQVIRYENNTSAVTISATAGISYDSSTHRYTATAKAYGDTSTEMASDSTTGGTQAYSAGWSGATGTVRINNSSSGAGDKTVQMSYGDTLTVTSQAKANDSASVYTTYGTVTVKAPAAPAGNMNIYTNQTSYNVSSYATVYVDVPVPSYTLANYAKKGLTAYNSSSKVTLYYYERNNYYSAGNYYWYHAGSGGWDTLYEAT